MSGDNVDDAYKNNMKKKDALMCEHWCVLIESRGINNVLLLKDEGMDN